MKVIGQLISIVIVLFVMEVIFHDDSEDMICPKCGGPMVHKGYKGETKCIPCDRKKK